MANLKQESSVRELVRQQDRLEKAKAEYPAPFKQRNRRNGALIEESPPHTLIDLTVVIPVLNEVDSLELLHSKLREALSGLDKSYEIIVVDDGSTDGSFQLLKEIQADDPSLRVIRFRRNFGQTAAFSAGFDAARGDVIITLDADLQNEPADIAMLLRKLDEGFDVVSGWRIDRHDKFLTRRLPSQVANFLISKLTGVELHDYGCSLKAYRADVVKNINLYGELHRFIPALASWQGVRVAEIPVRHAPRKFGQSKYGLSRVLKVLLDLLTVKFLLNYATRPIQIFGFLGLLALMSGSGLGFYLTVMRLFFNQPLNDRPILLLAILMVVSGVQLVTMGLLGELVVRTYHESQDKPIYMVREVLEVSSPTVE